MKKYLAIILLFTIIYSCTEQGKRVTAPDTALVQLVSQNEQNRDDSLFVLQNGILRYDKEPYSGIVKEYYPNRMLKSEATYHLGKRNGHYYGWHNNGTKWFERFYSNGTKTGAHVGWFEDSQQMFLYNFDKNGAYHGAVMDWHSNGIMASHFNYSHGNEDGSQRTWASNARLKANFHTVKGERYGLIGLKNCGGSTRILTKTK